MSFTDIEIIPGPSCNEAVIQDNGILPPLTPEFLKFLLSLFNKGLINANTVSVGLAITPSMKVIRIMTTKVPIEGLEILSQSDDEFDYSIDEDINVPRLENPFILVAINGKFVVMAPSLLFTENCPLSAITGEKPVRKVQAELSYANALSPNEFPNLEAAISVRKTVSAPAQPTGETLYEFILKLLLENGIIEFYIIRFIGKDGKLHKNKVVLRTFDIMTFKDEETCNRAHECHNVFCFYHGNFVERYIKDLKRLTEQNPTLKGFINNIIASYRKYEEAIDDEDDYGRLLNSSTQLLAKAISSIPLYSEDKKNHGVYLDDPRKSRI